MSTLLTASLSLALLLCVLLLIRQVRLRRALEILLRRLLAHLRSHSHETPKGVHEATLARLRRVQTADVGVRIEHRLEEGDVAERILAVAAEIQADLSVMGTHGRTGLTRLLMGSVAESVLRNASCPVLAYKSPVAAAEPTDPDFSDSQDQYIPLAF